MSGSQVHPIKLARFYAGITQTELADRIGRPQSHVARMEKGKLDWLSYIPQLMQATGLPLHFFEPGKQWTAPESAISFRKQTKCPAALRDRATFYSVVAHNTIAPFVGGYVKYPNIAIPFHPVEGSPDVASARDAGAAVARMVRSEWGVGWGPISDVIKLVESKGVRVFFVNEYSEFLDAFACWTDGIPYIFLNSNISDPARTRLDVVHELGHLIMHRDIALDSRTDLVEAMAFGFGIEFLAPWDTIKKEVPATAELGRLGMLRARWRVSMQAIVKHMHSNKHISDAMYSNAFRRFSFLGYRGGPEPGWIMPDSSAIHAKLVDVLEAKKIRPYELAEIATVPERLLTQMIPATGINIAEGDYSLPPRG